MRPPDDIAADLEASRRALAAIDSAITRWPTSYQFDPVMRQFLSERDKAQAWEDEALTAYLDAWQPEGLIHLTPCRDKVC